MKKSISSTIAALAMLLSAASASANVSLPAIFGDHMVLQEGKKVPIWGTAAPGEKVTVKFGHDSAGTTAGADGAWRVDLKPLAISSTGAPLTVTGTNTITFQDVVVGDVWLASGQSNMELTMGNLLGMTQNPAMKSPVDIKQVLADSVKYPLIRIFHVANKPAITPRADVAGGQWQVSSPDSVGSSSAVAYFFAQLLQEKLHRPIGLIDSYWGGQPIQTFMSRDALQKLVPFNTGGLQFIQPYVDAWNKLDAAGQAALVADYNAKMKDWQTNIDQPYGLAIQAWQKQDDAAKAAGQPEPPRPQESQPRPLNPDGEAGFHTTLYNGMIHPLIPYALKGALWYQGESNGSNDDTSRYYGNMLESMITDWRTSWNEPNFPFLVVGLADFGYRQPEPVDEGWASVREGEIHASEKLKNVAVAEAIDIGEAHGIHPIDKLDLSKRLAAAAFHVAYGLKGPWVGPTYAGEVIGKGKIRIKFAHAGAGLVIAPSPHIIDDNPALPLDHLVGFAIAGEDRKWAWADAKIVGDDVVVSSPQVPNPVAVRFAWANNPAMNLYNKEGFPAEPFRTDNWSFVPPPPAPAQW
jgi:sialate O-acetylesterase